MAETLSKRIEMLRDEVVGESKEDEKFSGVEIFDAIVRQLEDHGETSPAINLGLHEVLSRRLAWGEAEAAVIADADAICRRLALAAQRTLDDFEDELRVLDAATEISTAAARFVALAAARRSGIERAALRREEALRDKLEATIESQENEIAELKITLGPSAGDIS